MLALDLSGACEATHGACSMASRQPAWGDSSVSFRITPLPAIRRCWRPRFCPADEKAEAAGAPRLIDLRAAGNQAGVFQHVILLSFAANRAAQEQLSKWAAQGHRSIGRPLVRSGKPCDGIAVY